MRKIVLVGHGDGCTGMKKSTEMILGKQDHLVAIALKESESLNDYLKKVQTSVDEYKKEGYDELFLLADIKGGTPGNVATLLGKQQEHIHVIAGYHLAMILTACTNNQISGHDLLKESNQMIQEII
ncbi:MAG: hypothetical protein L0I95_13020 [Tetragenococcus koreensis]|uniref:PTS sugar transporter subunit IIA n=1 Tax=Tetragenococcus halophilus TaxID=51669 RepID=UPI001B721F2E|nr:hypothetical protein [Tetragenococcus halophilus]MDN6140661.1 hypothetical protein [Tetragenococcus koreensis]MDN6749800.1 hypothetical protein [Staphylococcus equorum]MCF1602532.1 hypothetical protein [Tetragenococcus halophilus]MCO8287031.1 hypothetical protein [Tetragenococcus halophilus]MDN6147010.1 hypothetical protein [Tetragenococcus koreensis]